MKKILMVLMAVLLALSVSTVFANDEEQSVSDMTATSNAVTNGKTSNSLLMDRASGFSPWVSREWFYHA